MAAGAFTLFSKNKDDFRINDLTGATIHVALVTNSYTPDTNSTTGHSLWSEVSANEIANGFGYVTGGQALASDVATAIAGGFKYTSSNVAWTATGGSIPAWRYYVMYVVGSLWGMTNPIIGYALGDSTPADIPATSDTNILTLSVPSGGWFDIT